MTMPNTTSCHADGCSVTEGLMGWNRWATPEQVQLFINLGEIPPGSTEATVMSLSCEEHQLTPAGLMTYTHDADCAAPPVCDCSVLQQYEEGQ